MKTEIFSAALGIEDIKKQEILPPESKELVIKEEPEVPALLNKEDQQQDYTLARNTFRSLIKQGNEAIDNISELAKQSESPRAYEVLATLMKTVADTTKDLYDLQKKTKDLMQNDKSRPQDDARVNVEKAVFVGSPSALLKKIKEDNA